MRLVIIKNNFLYCTIVTVNYNAVCKSMYMSLLKKL